MSVAVVRSHPDEPDPRVEFAVELRILIGAAVVRDLDHVDAGHSEPPAACSDWPRVMVDAPLKAPRA